MQHDHASIHYTELLTEAEVADLTRIPAATLATWRHRHKGPPFVQLGARTPRYVRAEVLAWIAERSVKP